MKTIVLTDIEGTTSSISFVRNVLFPYARKAMPAFIHERSWEGEVRRWLDIVADEIDDPEADDDTLIDTLIEWIDRDRKHVALKALEGLMWKDGYSNGDFNAHVYADAVEALDRWYEAGHDIYVYSSGSVAAQKLFFSHSEAGDMTPIFNDHFDTEIGSKREVESYARIAKEIGCEPSQILFLSDVVEELDAARQAGMRTTLLDRRDDYPQPRNGDATHGHPRVESFTQITL